MVGLSNLMSELRRLLSAVTINKQGGIAGTGLLN